MRSAHRFVSKYETGERRLDAIAFREICRVLGTGLPEFAERREVRPAAPPGRGRAGADPA